MLVGPLENENVGDRECPNCENESLLENSNRTWKCQVCGNEYDEDWLEDGEEEEEG